MQMPKRAPPRASALKGEDSHRAQTSFLGLPALILLLVSVPAHGEHLALGPAVRRRCRGLLPWGRGPHTPRAEPLPIRHSQQRRLQALQVPRRVTAIAQHKCVFSTTFLLSAAADLAWQGGQRSIMPLGALAPILLQPPRSALCHMPTRYSAHGWGEALPHPSHEPYPQQCKHRWWVAGRQAPLAVRHPSPQGSLRQ